ncbi:uncharacterized protein LOC142742662 [Rhinoderma darwinii]|uniref:uncharacterized protein LOC142742662 n=1 Tax=Rhinoderma darwinii TaxID=43563 RepID=UPI003F672706
MAPPTYRRMHIDVDALISEVQASPNLWDKQVAGYSNCAQRQDSWEEICVALYPDWVRHSNKEQGDIEKGLQTCWKSIRDRFQRYLKKAERSGSSPSQGSPCPFHQQLLYLLPNRALHQSSGNVRQLMEECPAAVEEQQLRERDPSPSTSREDPLEAEPHFPSDAEPSGMSPSSEVAEEITAPPAATQVPLGTQHGRHTPPALLASDSDLGGPSGQSSVN